MQGSAKVNRHYRRPHTAETPRRHQSFPNDPADVCHDGGGGGGRVPQYVFISKDGAPPQADR